MRHKAWTIKENPEGLYKYGWVIVYRPTKTVSGQIASLISYKTVAGAKRACMKWAEHLKIKVEWIEGLNERELR